jgi:hypothetical protein
MKGQGPLLKSIETSRQQQQRGKPSGGCLCTVASLGRAEGVLLSQGWEEPLPFEKEVSEPFPTHWAPSLTEPVSRANLPCEFPYLPINSSLVG